MFCIIIFDVNVSPIALYSLMFCDAAASQWQHSFQMEAVLPLGEKLSELLRQGGKVPLSILYHMK